MTASAPALVRQVTVLVDVKAVFLSGATVEAFKTHPYRYVASDLQHTHPRWKIASKKPRFLNRLYLISRLIVFCEF